MDRPVFTATKSREDASGRCAPAPPAMRTSLLGGDSPASAAPEEPGA